MIALSTLVQRFEADFLTQYSASPSQLQAMAAFKRCRTHLGPSMLAQCSGCPAQRVVPHSCGHRHCPPGRLHEGTVAQRAIRPSSFSR